MAVSVVAVTMGLGIGPLWAAEPAERPNIIFILADDLGYGDLGCYGQKQIRTPAIDRMASEGMLCTECYAGSTVCAPSRCALVTGLHTGHARIRGNADVPLEPQDMTVAEVLHRAGYVTGLIGKWGLGEPGSSGVPTRQGFDSFFGYLNQAHALSWELHERPASAQAARMGPWKAVRENPTAPIALYDLRTDIAEAHDVAAEHPDIAAKITRYLNSARTESKEFPLRTGLRPRKRRSQ